MVNLVELVQQIAVEIKKRSLIGHTHSRIENTLGSLSLDSAGGMQHAVNGARRWWSDDTGTLRQGTVPFERVTGAPPAPNAPASLKVVPLAVTTGQTGVGAPTSRAYRLPLRFNAPINRWRVHIRNWNPRLGTVVAAPVNMTGLWLADHAGSGVVTGTPHQIQAAFSTPADGSDWVSGWQTVPLGGDVDRLLCFGYTTTLNPPALVGGSYNFAETDRAITPALVPGQGSAAPFDIWIEAETPASTPVIAGVGDSLTAGVGADLPVYDSWVSQYARRTGGLPLHVAHAGDSMTGFLTANPGKVTRWASLARADAVVWGLGSNDIASTNTIARMQQDYAALLPIVEAAVGPVRYVSTVQPRNGWDATAEAKRTQWNTWVTSRPEMRGVLDFSALVSADGDTLLPVFDSGDGTHLNTAGYKAEADSIATALAAPAPAPATIATRITTLETDSGLRNLTALFGLTSGTAYLHVKGGWVWLAFNNAVPATTGAVILTAAGLLSVAPQAPIASAEGNVGTGAASTPRRLEVNRNGQARILGVVAGDVLNGSLSWPMTRPAPATWPGAATT